MKSPVYFAPGDGCADPGLLNGLEVLLDRVRLGKKIREKDFVAVKLHFGEKGNTAYVRPSYVARVVGRVAALGANPFLTDTNTLYVGSRGDAVSHLKLAHDHGFDYVAVHAPVVIADGLRGNSSVAVPVEGHLFKTAFIAREIAMADALISVAHFKGHELAGFGGALKNLGMGCASREGKLAQHSNIAPRIRESACRACGRCLGRCAAGAIEIRPAKPQVERRHGLLQTAWIDPGKCTGCGDCIHVCPDEAVRIRWNESIPVFQKKMVEYARAVMETKRGKILFFNVLTQITPACDCSGVSDTPIVGDIGILASEDPVAIDQASVDLVNAQPGERTSQLRGGFDPGGDKFHSLYPDVDWRVQLAYGEKIGLGTRNHELINVGRE
jgi:uncharacterized protein